jgi:hypothetical protein
VSSLRQRLDRLAAARRQPSPFDAMDPILAELSLSELVALVRRGKNVERGIRPAPEQEAVYGRVREQLIVVGIARP